MFIHTRTDIHLISGCRARFLRCWKRTFASQTFVVPGRRCNRIIEWFRIMRPTGTENVDFSKTTEKNNKNRIKSRFTKQTNWLEGWPEEQKIRKTNQHKNKTNSKPGFPSVFEFCSFVFFGGLVCIFSVCHVFFVFFLCKYFFCKTPRSLLLDP